MGAFVGLFGDGRLGRGRPTIPASMKAAEEHIEGLDVTEQDITRWLALATVSELERLGYQVEKELDARDLSKMRGQFAKVLLS